MKGDDLECDYFEDMKADGSGRYHYEDEYMFDYSWAEETNARLSSGRTGRGGGEKYGVRILNLIIFKIRGNSCTSVAQAALY